MKKASRQGMHRRLFVTAAIVCCAFSLLVVRLWYLQVVKGSFFRNESDNNRTRAVQIRAPRGVMFDREGRIMARSRPSFDLSVMVEDVPNLSDLLGRTSQILGRDEFSLARHLQLQQSRRRFESRVIVSDLTFEELARIKGQSYRLPGSFITYGPVRQYPFGSLGAHVVGYVREISRDQLLSEWGEKFKQGDLVGQSGVEKTWEDSIRGEDGWDRILVDSRGVRRGQLGADEALTGHDLQLTLDLDLQYVAERLLSGKKGAVVGIDPRNGEILVLASSPSFDPNIFSGRVDAQRWKELSSNRDKPLFNRAIGQRYAPGSTIKLFASVTGLAEGKITPKSQVNCSGSYFFSGRAYKCHKKGGHGTVDLRRAVTMSCNTYFFHLGNMLGVETIHRYGEMFGFGSPTGIDLEGEDTGTLPSDEWKRKTHYDKWWPGDTLSVAIGQGYLTVTPIQLAQMVSIIANGGTVYRPHVVRQTYDALKRVWTPKEIEIVRKLPVGPEVFEAVRAAALSVVSDPSGTGKKAQIPGVLVAGKTGTAQVTALGSEHSAKELNDNALFVSFAPADHPLIALAVVVENGGMGGAAAAPIAHDILEVFLRKRGLVPTKEQLQLRMAADDSGAPATEKKPPKKAKNA